MPDLLRMDFINALPQPLLIRQWGCGIWWPVHDIGVDAALVRIDVCGLLQPIHFSDCASIKDAEDVEHDPDTFYSDYEVSR